MDSKGRSDGSTSVTERTETTAETGPAEVEAPVERKMEEQEAPSPPTDPIHDAAASATEQEQKASAASPAGAKAPAVVTPSVMAAGKPGVTSPAKPDALVEVLPPPKVKERRHFLVWKVAARARAEALDNEADVLRLTAQGAAVKQLDIAHAYLTDARRICAPDSGIIDRLAEFIELYTGSAQERAWSAIHEADELLTRLREDAEVRAEVPNLTRTIKERVANEKDRDDLTKALTKDVESNPMNKSGVAQLKRLLYTLSDEGYEEKRSFRNIVIIMIVFVAAVAGILAVPGWFGENLFKPLLAVSGSETPPLWKVEFIGAIAGLFVAIVALNKLAGLRGPYSLQFVQAVLKIPMGALTGLIGAVIVRSGQLTIGPATKPVVFFTWVFVFGGSQQLITRFVDKKAKSVLEEAKPGA
jgi:hypothetical protein